MHRKRAIDRYLNQGLGARAEARLRTHVASCASCRDHYNRQLRLHRAFAGDVNTPTVNESSRMLRRALEGMGLEGMALKSMAANDERLGFFAQLMASQRPVLGGFAIAAVAFLVVVNLDRGTNLDRGAPPTAAATTANTTQSGSFVGLQTRAPSSAPAVGLSVRCVDDQKARVLSRAEAGPRSPLASLECARLQQLSFAPTNLSEHAIYFFVVGMDGSSPRWLAPFSPQSGAMRVEPGVVDEPLKVLSELDRDFALGRLTLYVLFSKHPFSGSAIASALANDAELKSTSALDRLPVEVPWQARIEVTLHDAEH